MRRTTRLWVTTAVLSTALGAGTTAAVAAPATPSPAVQVCGHGTALVRPATVMLACADNGEQAEQLAWSSWTADEATATGVVSWRAGSGRWDQAAAEFTLSDPAADASGRVLFTRMRLHTTGATPAGFKRDLTFDETPLTVAPAAPRSAATPPAPGSGPSGTLAYADIEGFWDIAGGPSSQAETAAAITGAESSFLPGIIQQGVDYCGSGSDEAGWGLWQITCGNSVPAYGTNFQLLDPWNNAEAAVYKYDSAVDAGEDGFTPWTTYDDGAYTGFLDNVAASTNLTDPGEYVQDGSTPAGTPSSPAADPGSTYGPGMPGASIPVYADGSGGRVAAGVHADGRMEVFSVTASGGIENKYEQTPNGSWSGWNDFGPNATVTEVATGRHADGRLEVFAVLSNGAVDNKYETVADGTWSGWNGFAPAGTAKSLTVGIHADGRMEVFAVTPSGGVENKYETAPDGAWSGWNGFGPSGTVDSVAAATHADGRLEVFAVMSNGSLQNKYETAPDGTWSGWNGFASAGTADGTGSPGTDAAGVHADGRVEVFAVTPTGGLDNKYETQPDGAWSGWNGFGPNATVTAAATARHADGRLEVFAVLANGSIENKFETSPDGAWSGWNDYASNGFALP